MVVGYVEEKYSRIEDTIRQSSEVGSDPYRGTFGGGIGMIGDGKMSVINKAGNFNFEDQDQFFEREHDDNDTEFHSMIDCNQDIFNEMSKSFIYPTLGKGESFRTVANDMSMNAFKKKSNNEIIGNILPKSITNTGVGNAVKAVSLFCYKNKRDSCEMKSM